MLDTFFSRQRFEKSETISNEKLVKRGINKALDYQLKWTLFIMDTYLSDFKLAWPKNKENMIFRLSLNFVNDKKGVHIKQSPL